MEIKLCRICGKQDDNYVQIFKTDGLKNKIETCLPIVVTRHCPLPATVCIECLERVEDIYSFIKKCLQNIIILESRYDIIESCIKSKRKVDKTVAVDSSDFLTINSDVICPKLPPKLLSDPQSKPVIPNFTCGLVDYESSSDEDDASDVVKTECPPIVTNSVENRTTIIEEIVQRKHLKRKSSDSPPPPSKHARFHDSSSRRKNKQPKKIEITPRIPDTILEPNYFAPDVPEPLLNLPADLSIIPEPTVKQQCLLCEQKLSNVLALTGHMYEIHGIDLSQVYNGPHQLKTTPNPVPTPAFKAAPRKIPELVKISDVLGPRRQKNHDILTDETTQPESSLMKTQLFSCSECIEPTPFTIFSDYSTHRRAQHQIFHCDLCPKFYGRNSHLWKHVNRVHKGNPLITCPQCYKTSASKYHLAQHYNKMHSTKNTPPAIQVLVTKSRKTPDDGLMNGLDKDDELLTQKYEGFDFKSVRQSFLKQELISKQRRHKLVSILKKKGDEVPKQRVDGSGESKNAPKEIDSSSDLYTNIITNYTPPHNEGPHKCPKCFKGFHKKNLLKKHKKNCRPRLQKDLLTRCKSCSRIFKDRQSLAKHLVNYHSEYQCEICGVAVQSKCEIVSHIRFTHPNSPELQCYCGQILRSKSDLLKHKSEHRDSHVCQFCGDALPTKIKLKMHILSLHRKILSLSCGICLKLFETQHILKEHVRLIHGHQLQPLTSCTVCGKNYGSKWKTYDHLNKSHGRIFKACKTCLDVFQTEKELQTHFEREHIKGNTTSTPSASVSSNNKIKNGTDISPIPTDQANTSDDEQLEEPLENIPPVVVAPPARTEIKIQNGIFGQKAIENKLSLLEKRLVGKKVEFVNEEENKIPTKKPANNKKHITNQLKVPEKDLNPQIKDTNSDILQNSSKRTVYVNSNDPSLCEICLKVWPAKKHLWQHYIRCHKQVAATVCGICLKTNDTYSTLQRHLKETHPTLLHGCGFGSNFICKICGRYHNASSKLKLHMAIHVGYNEKSTESADEPKEIKQELDDDDEDDDDEDDDDGEEDLREETQTKHDPDDEHSNENDDEQNDDDDEEEEEDELEEDGDIDEDARYKSEHHQTEELETNGEETYEENSEECEPAMMMKQENEEQDESNDYLEEDEDPDENADHLNMDMDSEDSNQSVHHSEVIKQEDINYESLIEEIEASSDSSEVVSDSEEEFLEPETIEKDLYHNQSENTLEQEMLKNMLGELKSGEKYPEQQPPKPPPRLLETYEIQLVDSCDVKMEVCSSPDNWTATQFVVKQSEVDDAIRSISYEDYERNTSLNESELETAVGSIL